MYVNGQDGKENCKLLPERKKLFGLFEKNQNNSSKPLTRQIKRDII